jgi:GNAT superfamily N-acetyltransferase
MSNLVLKTRAESTELKKAACSIEQAAWNDLGYLNYTRAHFESYGELLEHFPDYQMCLVDEELGYPVAVANCVPMYFSDTDELPAEGWDWVVERATESRRTGKANVLGGLAISIPDVYRARGYGHIMIRAMVDKAARNGLSCLLAPVRPSAKARFPRVPIHEYINWTDGYGRPFDPWLRSHLSSGGKLIGPCERSMVVHEHIGFWQNWSKQRFETSGFYEIEGALAPVDIDVEHLMGRYEEPNVWVVYQAERMTKPISEMLASRRRRTH